MFDGIAKLVSENKRHEIQRRRSVPPGAFCVHHDDRPAFAECPECGQYQCFSCWHPEVDRCRTCLRAELADSSTMAATIPWERKDLGFVRRLVGTLATAFQPVRSAPAMARPNLLPAVTFALLTTLVPALLRGVIPFTHTLEFGPSFAFGTIGSPSLAQIEMDLIHAMGISLLVTGVVFGALAGPLVSLSKSYGEPLAWVAALRLMLYRAWLLPLTMNGIIMGLGAWGLPANPNVGLMFLVQMSDLIPLILLVSSMRATVRLAGGLGPFRSYLLIAVAVALMMVSTLVMFTLMEPWLPRSLVSLP